MHHALQHMYFGTWPNVQKSCPAVALHQPSRLLSLCRGLDPTAIDGKLPPGYGKDGDGAYHAHSGPTPGSSDLQS